MKEEDVCQHYLVEYDCTGEVQSFILNTRDQGYFHFHFCLYFHFTKLSFPCEICFYYSKLISSADMAIHSFNKSLSCRIPNFSV